MLNKTNGLCWHGIADVYALADAPQYPSVSAITRSTGYWELDQLFKIYPGQFCLLHGATNHGKSTFLMNLICNQFAEHGTKSFLFMPENERHLKERLGLIWGNRQNWDQFAEIGVVLGSSIPRQDQSPRDLGWILGRAYDCHKEGHGGIVCLDPWNEIDFTRPKDVPQTEFIGWCLRDITKFARETNLTVFLSAHPTKSGVADGKIPGPYDLADSAHFANKPDNILCVYRDPNTKATSVISQKVREIGAGKRGVCVFDVDEDTGIFTPQHGAVSI